MAELFAVAAPGLERWVLEEVRELLPAGHDVEQVPGGVEVSGADPEALRTLLLHAALPARVLVRIGSFRARGFNELERRAATLDLSPFRPERGVAFEVTSRKSRLYHTGAIEERLRRVFGLPTPDETRPGHEPGEAAAGSERGRDPDPAGEDASEPAGLRIVVRVHRDRFTLSADASGAALHRRGYRLRTAKAPMRETLAATLLRASGWTPERPLHDPFCGSGTLPIEAARRALGIPPGIDRTFDAEEWTDADTAAWESERAQARASAAHEDEIRVSGSDRDAGAIEAARENAERAGVTHAVRFGVAPISAAPIPEGAVVVTNPPWGHRISGGDLRNLHAAFGRRCREVGVGGVTVLTDSARFGREAGLPVEPLAATRSGGIDVRILRTRPTFSGP